MFYDWSSKGSTYSAVVPLTNLFGLYQIPEPEPGQLTPINLVFQCPIFDTKLKLRYLLSDLKLWHKKNPGWSVRNELTTTNWSWLIRLMMKMLKRFVHGLILQNFWHVDLKENGRILTLIRSLLFSIITLLYIGFGNWINSNIYNSTVITD